MIRGTIAELIASNINLNGVKLGPAELSVLTRVGAGVFVNKVGVAPKPEGQKKGKPATIWEFSDTAQVQFAQG